MRCSSLSRSHYQIQFSVASGNLQKENQRDYFSAHKATSSHPRRIINLVENLKKKPLHEREKGEHVKAKEKFSNEIFMYAFQRFKLLNRLSWLKKYEKEMMRGVLCVQDVNIFSLNLSTFFFFFLEIKF